MEKNNPTQKPGQAPKTADITPNKDEKTPPIIPAAHTPGPWTTYARGHIVEVRPVGPGLPIVRWDGFDESNVPLKTHKANARLMAAAPDLLEALRPFAALYSFKPHVPDDYDLQHLPRLEHWHFARAAELIKKVTAAPEPTP